MSNDYPESPNAQSPEGTPNVSPGESTTPIPQPGSTQGSSYPAPGPSSNPYTNYAGAPNEYTRSSANTQYGSGPASNNFGSLDDAKSMSAPFFKSLFDFSFSQFITIRFASFIYAVLLGLIAIGYLIIVVRGFVTSFGMGIGTMIGGAIVAFFYIIIVRLSLEFTVAMIRTAQNTSELVRKQ